ncbi:MULTISPECIES: NepR family anti-sigma factor [Gluconobacter]|uniref:NepR family anti-sigma factor n=1 Tax=Gluconobacter TaxID=441 RepID=UPI001C03D0F7|nr:MULTISPECIES: NepR family anti-sigma factor [Gluconobacter]
MTAGDKRKSSATEPRGEDQDSPFGIWLSRGLHQLFDDVANEPIPDELLRLIEEDRNK